MTALADNHQGCPETHYALGSFFMTINELVEAEKGFSQTIALNPEHVAAYAARATLMVVLGREDEALTDTERVLTLSEDVPLLYEARTVRSAIYYRRGDLDALEQEANEMIALNPEWADGYQLRAAASVGRESWARAVRDLTETLERDPRGSDDPDEVTRFRAENFVGRGRARLELGELDAARSDLDEAIDLFGENGRAYLYRARVNRLQDRLDDARADLQMAIEHARSPEDRAEAEAVLQEIGGQGPSARPLRSP